VIDSAQMAAAEQKKVLDPFSAEINKPSRNMDSTLKANGYDSRNRPNIFVPLYVCLYSQGWEYTPESPRCKFKEVFAEVL
jgi:hypothetical protein